MGKISSTIELVDNMSSKLSEIETNINSMKNTLKSVSGEQSAIDKFNWNTFLSNAENAGKKIKKIGNEMTLALTTPLLLLGKKMYGAATDYESAFAGVKKTTDATEEEYAQLYSDLLGISETTPTGFVEAAGIMEMAGQLGVAKDELTDFTKTYIALQASTNIQGEEGAANLARFLNVTEKTTKNVDKVGGVIVALGNNFATTEDEILSMATRMGATADLAGFSSAEILAFSAALSSVGINAEAGGSAAGKLMKKMQLAAEVGGTAQARLASAGFNYDNGLDFVNALSTMKKADIADIADSLGITVDAVQDLGNNWLAMEQFASVMGMDTSQFLKSWDESAAQSMLKFFQGLGSMDAEEGNSVLAQLAEMDLTEIRLSNLVAAMAGNGDLFQQALEMAYKEYGINFDDNALAEEFGKRLDTQESKNQMLGNKLENTMADFGDNLTKALQPALDLVNQILDAFNAMSESDQSALLATLGGIAVLGPTLSVVGTAMESIAKIGKLVSKLGKLKDLFGAVSGFLIGTPVGNAILLAGAIAGIAAALDSIPTDLEKLSQAGLDIPITIDDASYKETMSKIAEVQAALDGLKPGEVKTEYENTSAAVAFGYGTNEMYGTALAYEAAKANAQINDVASKGAEKLNEAQKKIADAAAAEKTAMEKGDMFGAETARAEAEAAVAEYENIKAELDAEIAGLKQDYTTKQSELFSGMVSQFPEAASALEKAATSYDVGVGAYQLLFNWDDDNYSDMEESAKAWTEEGMKVIEQAFNAGLYDDRKKGFNEDMNFAAGLLGSGNEVDFWNWDTVRAAIENDLTGFDLSTLLNEALTDSQTQLNESLQSVSDNPAIASYLQALINDPNLTENLDTTNLSGALEGIFKTLDYKHALEAGGKPVEWGNYVTEGLAQGLSESSDVPATAGSDMGTATIDAIKAALGVASPSTFMIEAGMFADQGLMMGIQQGQGMVIAAASAMGTMVVSVVRGIVSPGAGAGIGSNFAAGLASGIRSGIGAVTAAASALASAALGSVSGILAIHSPSRETYWQGEMMVAGYTNALMDGSSTINKTIGTVLNDAESRWNQGTWSLISGFTQREGQMWNDELNDVEEKITISDSDIKKIRSLAEREVINHFTTAEVKVEMNNTNNINNDMDVDGIISRLEDKVAERLEAVAEGVYT